MILKLKICLSLCIVLFTTQLKAQWLPINAGTISSINSIHFSSADTGYIATSYFPNGGEIWKTTDGASWTSQLAIADYLFTVHFTSNQTGYAGGGQIGGGLIMKTTDGGASWNAQTTNCEQILSLYFVNDTMGWAVGTDATQGTYFIYHTNDGGVTWITQQTGSDYVRSVFFISETTGWVAGDNGRIYGTTNGGNTWTLLNTGVVFHFNDIYFVNANLGWAVGSYGNGGVYKSTDGGNSWTAQSIPTTEQITSVHFVDANQGWISGTNGIVLMTYDGGTTWQTQISGTSSGLNTMYFLNENLGYVAGNSGAISKYTNPVILQKSKHLIDLNIFPNPSQGATTIKFTSNTIDRIELLNAQGMVVQSFPINFNLNEYALDLSPWANGMYFVKVYHSNGTQVQALSIIK